MMRKIVYVAFVCQILRVFTVKVSEDEEGAMDAIYNANEEAAMKNETLWEEDIKYTPEQLELMKNDNENRQRRDLTNKIRLRWPNNVVNYVLSSDYTAPEASIIRRSLDIIESQTCVRFQRFERGRTPQDYINLTKGTRCFSYIGRIRGRQQLSLSKRCLKEKVIIHEFLHALGFFHEQSRPDRDNFIKVFLDRVIKGRESNFDKKPANRIDSLGSPYDPISIMHYSAKTFANSDLPTMVWRANPNQRLGGRELSKEDINQINRFYNCPQATTTTTTTTTKTTATTTTTTSAPSTVTTSTTMTSPATTASATSTSTPSTVTTSTTATSPATTASTTSTSTPSTVTTSTTTTSPATTASATSTSTPSTVTTSTTATSPATTASTTSTSTPSTATTSTTATSPATTASATSTSVPSTASTSTAVVSPTTTDSATSTNQPTTSTIIPNQVCRDRFRQCSRYRRYCFILQDYCPETCGQCDCLKRAPDTSRKCSSWIARGFCTHARYGAFVRSKCSRGCCEHEAL